LWPSLEVSALEWDDWKSADIDVIQATDIDGDRITAVWRLAATKRAHAAMAAKQVVDDVLVELVVGQVVSAGLQLELICAREGPQCATLGADRAVAGDDASQLDGYLVAHSPAMAAARMDLRI
jgi:hypothetical protein